jgi:hypothetical protein
MLHIAHKHGSGGFSLPENPAEQNILPCGKTILHTGKTHDSTKETIFSKFVLGPFSRITGVKQDEDFHRH